MALAMSGALIASASAFAAPGGDLTPPALRQLAAATMGPSGAVEQVADQRDVIEPPSSIDPGMSLDPPNMGRMRIVPPPSAAPSGRPIMPR
jgi:hypothetical protein